MHKSGHEHSGVNLAGIPGNTRVVDPEGLDGCGEGVPLPTAGGAMPLPRKKTNN